MPDDEAYHRLGDFVCSRFRALGVADPQVQTLAFFRSPHRGWLGNGEFPDLSRLLLESTNVALTLGQVDPDERALGVYATTPDQATLLRASPPIVRLGLVLSVLDRFDVEEVATLTGSTATATRLALASVSDTLESLGRTETGGDHLSTLELHAFVLEVLDPLKTDQTDNHLAACPTCFARLEAWIQSREDFDALPPPPRARRRVRAGTLHRGCAGLAVFGLLVVVLVWVIVQPAPHPGWAGQPAEIILEVGEDRVEGVLPMGAPISVRFDANGASHYGLLRRNGGRLEPLLVDVTAAEGQTIAPVQVLVTSAPEQAVVVVLGDRPFTMNELASTLAEDLVASEIRYRAEE